MKRFVRQIKSSVHPNHILQMLLDYPLFVPHFLLFFFCQAKTHVCDIEQRLQGVIKSRNKVLGLPLSIAGHVHYLIQEATDDNLLCQMYLGWGPYL